jgi:CRISPR/Cas system CSM-associated protein Csm2 small subunit
MRYVGIALLAVCVVACSSVKKELSGSGGAKVSDEDLGRLGSDQLGPVNQARTKVAQAQDNVARSKLAEQDADHQKELAKADGAAAKADAQNAEAQQKIANDTRSPQQEQRAQTLTQNAQLRKQVSDAHEEFAKKLGDARSAEVEVANEQLDLANAQLEQARLQALQEAKVPAATKYNQGEILDRVSKAQQDVQQAQEKATQASTQAQASQTTWNQLRQQYQAQAGGAAPGG